MIDLASTLPLKLKTLATGLMCRGLLTVLSIEAMLYSVRDHQHLDTDCLRWTQTPCTRRLAFDSILQNLFTSLGHSGIHDGIITKCQWKRLVAQVNANLKTETTDELMGRKRTMHLTAFRYRIDEISDRLQVPHPPSTCDAVYNRVQ